MKPGAPAFQVIQNLIGLHPEIEELKLFEPSPVEKSHARIQVKEAEARQIVEQGLSIRERIGLPFWDSVLLASYGQGRGAAPVLEHALFHNGPPLREFTLTRQEWTEDRLQNLLNDSVQRSGILVVSSNVRLLTGGRAHIPMIDFRCPATDKNRELLICACKLIDRAGGYLLESGHSYHFYGKSLLQPEEFPAFLGRILLLSPIVDRAWIAHQLIEGACGLRISRAAATPEPLLSVEI